MTTKIAQKNNNIKFDKKYIYKIDESGKVYKADVKLEPEYIELTNELYTQVDDIRKVFFRLTKILKDKKIDLSATSSFDDIYTLLEQITIITDLEQLPTDKQRNYSRVDNGTLIIEDPSMVADYKSKL